ncbi:MAG: hypothetical protein ACRCWF_02915 [Beijerinckiaceae bacterium]
MTCNTNLHIARTFSRANVNAPKGHPMRGQLRSVQTPASEPSLNDVLVSAIKREHLLRKDEDAPDRRKIIVIRDTLISIMGAVSAMVPILIAIQSATGA